MANFIKEIRKSRGLSGEQLAEKVGTSPQQINYLENGKRKLTWAWLQKLSKALECHPLEITEGPASQPQALTAKEKELISIYRGLEEGSRRMFEHLVEGVVKSSEQQKKPTRKDKTIK